MALFDSYLMVDWSASSTPKRGKDSIWWAVREKSGAEQVGNPATREEAWRDIIDHLEAASSTGRRILVGFDFPFGHRAAQRKSSPASRAGLFESWMS
jgi:precorrin-8X/cobalt-precorrin-8 methylmutase